MRFIFIFLIVVLSSPGSWAQSLFQKQYGGSGSDCGNALLALPTGYLAAGRTEISPANTDGLVFQIDQNGTVQWMKTYGGSGREEVVAMEPTLDGNFILAGQTGSYSDTASDSTNAFLAKIDPAGNVVWSFNYGGMNPDGFQAVAVTSDSGLIATGYTSSFGSGDKDFLAVRTDKDGNLLWMKAYGGMGAEMGYSVIEDASGAFVICGTTGSFVAGNEACLLKLSSNGNLVWAKRYSYSYNIVAMQELAYDIIETPAGYLVAGSVGKGSINDAQPFLMSTDTSGAISWCNYYLMNSGDCGARSITPASSGYILGATMGNYYPALLSVSSSGAIQWTKHYGGISFTNRGYGTAATQTNDGGYMLTGIMVTSASPDSELVIIKTSTAGMSACNTQDPVMQGAANAMTATITSCAFGTTAGGEMFGIQLMAVGTTLNLTTICTDVGLEETEQVFEISVAPVPFAENFTVTCSGPLPNDAVFEIRDCMGRIVRQIQVDASTFIVPRENLSPGIYCWFLRSPGELLASGKIVAGE
jgi:hypothetical protein